MNFKCKMCGGELVVEKDNNVCVCSYCKSKQTVPSINDEVTSQLFERANYYRFSNEFDKALGIYEQILVNNIKESEAYWGVLLCRFGVEYVEDDKSKKRIPTCHRTIYESILDDINYKNAIKYASGEAEKIYLEEAKYIDNVQKRIKEISSKESPYDIFICYKESNGNDRTIDSVLAEDIYNNLVQKGYNVFFSRITLEGKLGVEYEPYIYNALTTSKIMLVVSTSVDNLNSVWVKNEWKRYLELVKKNKDKVLIPVFKNINVYDLPDEFSIFQSQDMSKVGAIQDLMRGIDKIIKPSQKEIGTDKIDSYLLNKNIDLAFQALNQSKWDEARNKLDTAKDYDSKYDKLYLGYLLIDLKLNSLEDLIMYPYDYFDNNNYKNLIKYANNELKDKLYGYRKNTEKIISERKVEEENNKKSLIKHAIIVSIVVLVIIVGVYIINLINKKYIIPNNYYKDAISLMENKDYESAYNVFSDIEYYKDSNEKMIDCIYQIQSELTNNNKSVDDRFEKYILHYEKDEIYKLLEKYYEFNNLNYFKTLYKYLKFYKDADNYYYELQYNDALSYYEDDIYECLSILSKLKNFGHGKSEIKFNEIIDNLYKEALSEYNKTNYGTARNKFDEIRDYNYRDSEEKYNSCIENIKREKERFYGTWLESEGFWTNLKIDEKGIYYADQIETKRNNWTSIDFEYDEDNAKYSFTYWTNHKYDVTVSGNTLRLKCTNLIDEYDSDWFKGFNVFYRG